MRCQVLTLLCLGALAPRADEPVWSVAEKSTLVRRFERGSAVELQSVEQAVSRTRRETPDVVIADPPRTGLSADALRGLAAWRSPRIVYVSCDPPTLARDAARLREAGYVLHAIDAFDLFPNTPHVETVAVFDRATLNPPS